MGQVGNLFPGWNSEYLLTVCDNQLLALFANQLCNLFCRKLKSSFVVTIMEKVLPVARQRSRGCDASSNAIATATSIVAFRLPDFR